MICYTSQAIVTPVIHLLVLTPDCIISKAIKAQYHGTNDYFSVNLKGYRKGGVKLCAVKIEQNVIEHPVYVQM